MADHAPWWPGLAVDHLYENCPGRQRGLPALADSGWDKPGRGTIDPLWDDVCGWCRRVWLARSPQLAGPSIVTVELPGISR